MLVVMICTKNGCLASEAWSSERKALSNRLSSATHHTFSITIDLSSKSVRSMTLKSYPEVGVHVIEIAVTAINELRGVTLHFGIRYGAQMIVIGPAHNGLARIGGVPSDKASRPRTVRVPVANMRSNFNPSRASLSSRASDSRFAISAKIAGRKAFQVISTTFFGRLIMAPAHTCRHCFSPE